MGTCMHMSVEGKESKGQTEHAWRYDYTERLEREHAYKHMCACVNTSRDKHHIIVHIAFLVHRHNAVRDQAFQARSFDSFKYG